MLNVQRSSYGLHTRWAKCVYLSLLVHLLLCLCIFREHQNIELPEEGRYATGMMFIDKDKGPEIQSVYDGW
jgi:hypothetical protein